MSREDSEREIQAKDFLRVANMLDYGATPGEIRRGLLDDGYDEGQAFLIHKAAQQLVAARSKCDRR